jgi:uracil-DNA glycosylase family 4
MKKKPKTTSDAWAALQQRIVDCTRCTRLREHCTSTAALKRAAFRDQTYWGKPVPNFGDRHARLLILGLAPAAHGANRTGRMFTGDRSGDFLYQAMHETGFANQPHATDLHDGLELRDVMITASAHCAPPANKPTPDELAACFDYLVQTVNLLPNLRGCLALGHIAYNEFIRLYRHLGWFTGRSAPKFAHGALHRFPRAPFILCSYHPSQQNTFTGKLTPPMMREIFLTARRELDAASG